MIIDFEKTIHFHAEVNDKQFIDEYNKINEDVIISYCESIDSPTDDETCWIYDDELKNITWKKSEDEKEHKMNKIQKEIDAFLLLLNINFIKSAYLNTLWVIM